MSQSDDNTPSNPKRPSFISNVADLPGQSYPYPGDDELMSYGTPLSRPLGLKRMGIHHEVLEPGMRTSWPHAEEKEEEFVYVLQGTPDVWINGELHPLRPGDCVAFVPGTGIAHTLLNNSTEPVQLLVIGESIADNRIFYPLHPNGYEGMKPARVWHDVPRLPMGSHNGKPNPQTR